MSNTKVCPKCGCDQFKSAEQVTRAVIVDGEGEVLEVREDMSVGVLLNTLTCAECSEDLTVPQLVTEEHFHEVIALEDKEYVHQ